MAIVLVLTWYRLRVRRKRYRIRIKVQEFFDQWLSEMLLGDFSEGTPFETPPELQDIPANAAGRQYAIDQLINTKKNLIGMAAGNVIFFYEKLGLRKHSVEKFNSHIWYKKAKGIYELYMMEQQDMQEEILAYTNSRNEYVRLEAQTAVLAFSGFDGLVFLDQLTQPMNSWQQVKLLEQLHPLDPGNLTQLPEWLRSENESVVIFALKLAEIYQQLQVTAEVTDCLQHPVERVRGQAILALKRIGDEATPTDLVNRYAVETPGNRKLILETLGSIATEAVRPFLEKELDSGDPTVQLQVARIIARSYPAGTAILEQKALATPSPYQQILLHVKSELAR